jgi:hypothetical protein
MALFRSVTQAFFPFSHSLPGYGGIDKSGHLVRSPTSSSQICRVSFDTNDGSKANLASHL